MPPTCIPSCPLVRACLVTVLLAACAGAQSAPDDGPSTPSLPPSPSGVILAAQDGTSDAAPETLPPAEEDPTAAAARTALERAARFQRGEVVRRAPRSLYGRFYVSLRGEDGSMIKATVERWYGVDPERMLTTRTEEVTGSTSSVGWDGRRAWFRDRASGDTVVFTDDPGTFDEDLAQLREQMRLTRLLLDAIVLDALVPRLEDARATGTRTIEDLEGGTHRVEVISARVEDALYGPPPGAPPPGPGDPAPRLVLELGLDAETGAPWTLSVTAPHRPEIAPLLLRFDFFGTSRDGLRVPGNIRVFRAGEARERMKLGVDVHVDEDGAESLMLDVDVALDDAVFAVPR